MPGSEKSSSDLQKKLERLQAQLVHQEKLVSLGELTAGVAQEIKNPLNFVRNFADANVELIGELREAIEAGEDPRQIIDDLARNAQRIVEHGRRTSEIVRSMMQHASAGKALRERVDLNALVSEHLALSYKSRQAHMPDLKIKVEQKLSRRIGKVELVPKDIGWVVLNLVNNAMDALQDFARSQTPDYKPIIRVSTRPLEKSVEIHIEDNGPGIPAEIKDKIFEPFFTTKPADIGTGLGLPLSHDIVVLGHEGTMIVESEVGKGTAFIVTIPLVHK